MIGRGARGHRFRYAAAAAVVARAGRASWLGSLADGVGLVDLLDDVFDRAEAVEWEIWRAHHARNVRFASRLGLDLLAMNGIEAEAAAASLGPYGAWPRWLCGAAPVTGPSSRRWSGAPGSGRSAFEGADAFLHGGRVLRPWSDPAGALGVRLSRHGLDVAVRAGPVLLGTWGGLAIASSRQAIPASLLAAMVGRDVDALLDHPALRDRGYRVRFAFHPHPGRARWMMIFETGREPWRVPWSG